MTEREMEIRRLSNKLWLRHPHYQGCRVTEPTMGMLLSAFDLDYREMERRIGLCDYALSQKQFSDRAGLRATRVFLARYRRRVKEGKQLPASIVQLLTPPAPARRRRDPVDPKMIGDPDARPMLLDDEDFPRSNTNDPCA